ncbi:hypothetical protein GH714_001728 [Hevea brasiliensis]|uniref:Terpene synthase metal-binding domain-containing protein n=1 Tax=Hevea brasiliensis TaxID=3981 RepID=A0A6A6KHR7_HEVBR|nr:hypothetical protein GH714_001728 [Hevea brasiliensis]
MRMLFYKWPCFDPYNDHKQALSSNSQRNGSASRAFGKQHGARDFSSIGLLPLPCGAVTLLHFLCLTPWWKELDLAKGLPYVRDRIAEGFFQSAGVQFEPNFALSRILLTKCIQILALVDDTYDSYGTLQELQCFTDALERGNSDQLPADYLKILYKAVLDFFEELGDDEGNEGRSYCINYTKERYKEVVRSYLVEAQWFYDGHLRPFNEYMHNALISSCFSLLPPVVFLGVEKLAGVKEFKWLETNPKLVEASKFFGRLLNDMVARKDEEKEGHCLAGNCYMKEYGVSKEKAMEELRKMCDNAWKDMNEESMRPTAVPMPLITQYKPCSYDGSCFPVR